MSIHRITVAPIQWEPIWRINHSILPQRELFARVADPEDYDAISIIENRTDAQFREDSGETKLVAEEQRITGPGSFHIMAAFTRLNPNGSRFSDGSYGVYYGASKYATAIAESKYHATLFYSSTKEEPTNINMQALRANLNADLHDIRGHVEQFSDLYAADDYSQSQQFAKELRSKGSAGIIYHSVRCENRGECAALFQANVLSNCVPDHYLCYEWNGEKIIDTYRKYPLEM